MVSLCGPQGCTTATGDGEVAGEVLCRSESAGTLPGTAYTVMSQRAWTGVLVGLPSLSLGVPTTQRRRGL